MEKAIESVKVAMNSTDKTTSHIRGTTPEIQAAARRLRRNMTPAEKKLWQALKGKQLDGLKFRAQHPVGPFILDFYCPTCKLVVELDGSVHEGQANYDDARTQHLHHYNYRVIRFCNEEVLQNLPSVLKRILEAAWEEPPNPVDDLRAADHCGQLPTARFTTLCFSQRRRRDFPLAKAVMPNDSGGGDGRCQLIRTALLRFPS